MPKHPLFIKARRVALALGFAAAGLCYASRAAVAQVASVFNFDFAFSSSLSGASNYGPLIGTFYATGASGAYTITSINGTLGGQTISLLSPGTFAGNDNMLYAPANPGYFTLGGVSFAMGGTDYNLYYNLGQYAVTPVNALNQGAAYTGTITPVAAPGPVPGAGLKSLFGMVASGLAIRLRSGVAWLRAVLRTRFASRRPRRPAAAI